MPCVNIYRQPNGGSFALSQTVNLTGGPLYPHVRMSYDGSTIIATTDTTGLTDGKIYVLKQNSSTYALVAS